MTQGDPQDMTDKKQDDTSEESPPPPSTPPRQAPPITGSHSAPTTSRKQLPSIPDPATQLSLAAKMMDRKGGPGGPRSSNSYGPCFLEYSLMSEYIQLQKQKLPGVYVIPSARSALFWNGVLFIRQGIYQEGIFRFSLFIPDNYPDGESPRLVFEPPVFHPVIDPVSGELDVKRGFVKWRRNVNHIWQVLLYARRVFYKIDTKNPLNPEAAVLYEQDLEVFKGKVTDSLKACKAKLYETPNTDDPHAIRFSDWNPEVHEEAKKQMLHPKEQSPSEPNKNAQTSGLSWMTKGSNQVFSKDSNSTSL